MKKKDVDTLWDDIRVWLTDATRTAIREAEDLTRRGRLKVEIMNLSRKIERLMAKLGGAVYEQSSREPDSPVSLDGDAKRVVREIAKLEEQRSGLQRQYDQEKKRRRQGRTD